MKLYKSESYFIISISCILLHQTKNLISECNTVNCGLTSEQITLWSRKVKEVYQVPSENTSKYAFMRNFSDNNMIPLCAVLY